ncbi:MAG: ABC transporter permease [Spirochaetales bacterium]|nr:ABC transporter permease [Spirochaetales bacterium]
MRLENLIARRYIRYSGENREISSSALTVIISIAVGIIFYICAVSIMNGYIYGVMQLSFEVKSFHVQYDGSRQENVPLTGSIEKRREALKGKGYTEMEELRLHFAEDKEVKYSALYRETNAVLQYSGKSTAVAFLRELPENIFQEDDGFDKGIRLLNGSKTLAFGEIMISSKTAQKLRVDVGDKIFVSFMENDNTTSVRIRKFTVSGIFSCGLSELDEQLAFIGRETGRRMFNELPYNLMLKLHHYNNAANFCAKYQAAGYMALTHWEEENYNELSALRFQRNIIAMIVILVLFVAVLNLLSTIHITVFEKKKEIGILRSTGFVPAQITSLFLYLGLYLAVLGIVPGVTLGLLLSYNLNAVIGGAGKILSVVNMMIYHVGNLFFESPKPLPIEFF